MLPSYTTPPLVEVVVGYSFQLQKPLTAAHLGAYWSSIRDRYPKVGQHDPIAAVIERFGSVSVPVGSISLQLANFPGSRLWLITEDDSELIQIQHDMFLRNWRRYSSPSVAYPRFESYVLPQFQKDWSDFSEFLSSNGLGEAKVQQAEITYVNHIVAEKGRGSPRLSDFISLFRDLGANDFESVSTHMTKLLAVSGAPVGRLHVTTQTGVKNGLPAVTLSLTARGFADPIDNFLKLGHEAIVNNFTAVTTLEMHKEWGRVQ